MRKNARPIGLISALSLAMLGGGWVAAQDQNRSPNQNQPPANAGQQTQSPPSQGQQTQGQQNQGQQAQGPQTRTEMISVSIPIWTTTAGAIAAAPARYYGNIVSVRAEIEDVFSQRAFTLDEDRIGAGPDVLVILPRAAGEIPEGEEVTVVGHVRPMTSASLDRDYDWYDASWFRAVQNFDWETRPAIIAASVRTENGRELLTAPRTE